MRLLHVDASITGQQSASRELSAAIVARWRAQNPAGQVVRLDLDAEPLPHLSSVTLANPSPEDAARAERVLTDFLAADVIVLGAPMYNFGLPSTLKAWIDRITVAGRTFSYTANGVTGLAGGKQVVVVLSRGGIYGGDAPGDFVEPYLKFIFGFLGIGALQFVRAEGMAISADHRTQGMKAAHAQLATLPLLATR